MVPSARNVEITARPCSFAPSWAASSRVVMCSPFVPCLRLKGSSFWLTIRKGHDLIAVLTTGSLRSYCPVSDPWADTELGSDASSSFRVRTPRSTLPGGEPSDSGKHLSPDLRCLLALLFPSRAPSYKTRPCH